MEGFVKQTKTKSLNGYLKAAILLGELGQDAGQLVLNSLNLSKKQSHKIRKNMKKLGKYNPNDLSQINREISVLNETIRYGKLKGIFDESKTVKNTFISKTENNLKQMANEDPNSIANVIKMWLDK